MIVTNLRLLFPEKLLTFPDIKIGRNMYTDRYRMYLNRIKKAVLSDGFIS